MPVSRIRLHFGSEVKANSRRVFLEQCDVLRANARRRRLPSVRSTAVVSILLLVAGGAGAPAGFDASFQLVCRQFASYVDLALSWYRQTPAVGRISWGGLAVCAALGLWVLLERFVRLQRNRVLPARFVDRLLDRLGEGKLDRAKGFDLCAMNPSAAARVARAALERWGRSTADLERAVALASRVETGRLWRSVGTLRRIAVLAPLLGLLGTLSSFSLALASAGPLLPSPALGEALQPLIAGVALAVVALAAYDGLVARVEDLVHALDSLGAAIVDALAMVPTLDPRTGDRRARAASPAGPAPTARTSHQTRADAPEINT
jgi:biopolymer transport protein ExbB